MFSKIFISAVLVLALAFQVSAHAAVAPALGVAGGKPTRADVQRPSNAKPCGSINAAAAINSATTVAANANGVFTVSATNFNGGIDGSRQFTAEVDTGNGKFVASTITKNGQRDPQNVGTEQLTVQLPTNTKCTGGQKGNVCVVSFTSLGGFGNCIAVTTTTSTKHEIRGGTLAARAAKLAELEARTEKGFEVIKREVSSWFA